eukprot:scaffold23151_cov117-Isochrysis_galbana.AAC.5
MATSLPLATAKKAPPVEYLRSSRLGVSIFCHSTTPVHETWYAMTRPASRKPTSRWRPDGWAHHRAPRANLVATEGPIDAHREEEGARDRGGDRHDRSRVPVAEDGLVQLLLIRAGGAAGLGLRVDQVHATNVVAEYERRIALGTDVDAAHTVTANRRRGLGSSVEVKVPTWPVAEHHHLAIRAPHQQCDRPLYWLRGPSQLIETRHCRQAYRPLPFVYVQLLLQLVVGDEHDQARRRHEDHLGGGDPDVPDRVQRRLTAEGAVLEHCEQAALIQPVHAQRRRDGHDCVIIRLEADRCRRLHERQGAYVPLLLPFPNKDYTPALAGPAFFIRAAARRLASPSVRAGRLGHNRRLRSSASSGTTKYMLAIAREG